MGVPPQEAPKGHLGQEVRFRKSRDILSRRSTIKPESEISSKPLHGIVFQMDLNSSEVAEEVRKKTILHWNYRDFKELPIVLRSYGSHVKEIYLKWNHLKSLPAWIEELENLTNLYLCGNFIQTLPPEVQYTRLTLLDLNSNRLETIPSSIGNLGTLKCLLLDENLITRIPLSCSQLWNLEYFSISNNRLIILPEWLGSLPKLEDLIVDNNFLEELPNRLTLAPELRNISVCSNRLKYLPLNGFVSSPFIQFDQNRDLNYLSYPLLSQLVSKIRNSFGGDLRNAVARGCFLSIPRSDFRSCNIKLRLSEEIGIEEITIDLPRQLMTVHKISENVVTSLWELALRKVYSTRYHHSLEITSPLNVKVSYEPFFQENSDLKFSENCIPYVLIENGPVSICVNNSCQEPIFTDAWVTFGLGSDVYEIPTVALFCSHRCAAQFSTLSGSRNNRFFINE
ncbi:leucine-rich repeat-containing protein 28-like isoform X2 [Belonocnema kinseyi]|uniref:leucine-rich repeat-containing protein 28-like isoform X2 n=1 Tax=Belonocnema kinseyi TaxID=2817044 RepID=UPI00143D9502|nr:leucine-rich repeat-containing protein 28-like isoform X2 [Belonocnema kinseyi]